MPLSFELPRPGVTRRTALRSSDFPPACGTSSSPACRTAAIVWHATAAAIWLTGCYASESVIASRYPSVSCVIRYCSSFL